MSWHNAAHAARGRFAAIAAIAAMACVAFAPRPAWPTPAEPRAFGHFIGDTLTRSWRITVARADHLNEDDLPRLGGVTPWLALIERRVESDVRGGDRVYRLTLTYQIINSAAQPQVVSLPEVVLRSVGGANGGDPYGGGAGVDARLPALPLILAPLTVSDLREGFEATRPQRPPRLLDTIAPARAAGSFAACGALLTLCFWARRRGWPFSDGRRAAFASAYRHLRRLARQAPTPERQRTALRAVHRAFDETAGRRVFAEHLEEFFLEHPAFSEHRDRARQFFSASRAEFFAAAPLEPMPIESLLAWCAQLKSQERRLPRVPAV